MLSTNNQFAIVVSRFNETITEKLLQGVLSRFNELNISQENINIVHVPGAFEIPLTAKLLAKTKKYNAIICLGAVIRGDTSHYDYVCQQVSTGCMQVMLECEVPVIFGVLTTDNEKQAEDRVGGSEGHKGIDAVETAMAMIKTISSI